MSNVREMIQIAFEYEVKLQQAAQKIAELEKALASYKDRDNAKCVVRSEE